jgi:membrane-anchored glycerophosphoryl diester phosphodiesterase (GDPDase)
MFDVFRRSYGIFKQSLAILAADKEILIFPFLSGIAMIFVFALMIGGGFFMGVFRAILETAGQGSASEVIGYAVLFVWYFLSWFVALFFNVAVIHCAKIRLDGGDPTVSDGISASMRHLGRIAAWAAISATVGVVAQILKDKMKGLTRLFVSVGEAAWGVATFFIVPVMIFEERPVLDSVKQSWNLVKKTWGESLVGSGGIGLFIFLLAIPGIVPIILGVLLGSGGAVIGGVAVAVLYWLVLACVSSALGGIYRAALYVYATEQRVAPGFSQEYVAGAFKRK